MFRPTNLSLVIAVAAFLGNGLDLAAGAAAGKAGITQRGKMALEHMSTKGTLNNNAQWSADPDRGWVRADERHRLREKTGTGNEVKNSEKQKGKGKAKKF